MRYFGGVGKTLKRGAGTKVLKTIFGNKTAAVAPKHPAMVHDEPEHKKERKRRSDAKQDIKFKLSLEDRQQLKLRARDHKLSLTAFSSMVVQTELKQQPKSYDHFEYDHDGKFVHVMLDQEFFKQVQDLSIAWDLPYRHVVHRIIKDYLCDVYGGLKITNYRG